MRLIDMHCDTILHFMNNENLHLQRNELCIDIEKMRKANSMAQFFACFVNLRKFDEQSGYDKAYQYALEMITRGKKEIAANSKDISLALTFNDLVENEKAGKMSAFLTVEEGGIIHNDMSRLEQLYEEGVRLITLTWNYENCIGFPNKLTGGLKPFGIEVVKRMNELGMLIDVSHLSDDGFWDVIKYSSKPIVASHSNARALCNHPRNLTDDMIKALAENGGTAGLNLYPCFLKKLGKVSVSDMAEHIVHMYQVGGEDVIAIGTDFDGFDDGESEIVHMGQMNILYDEIQKHGFSERQMEKFWNGNAMRVIKGVMR